jgi:hypothetical protein
MELAKNASKRFKGNQMNDKQFFNKIGLECQHDSDRCCLECEAKIDNKGCPENCEAFQFPEITADHIFALEGLIKLPYSFEVILCHGAKYTLRLCKLIKRKTIAKKERHSRKEALKALISWMIDEKILTKEDVKAVFA